MAQNSAELSATQDGQAQSSKILDLLWRHHISPSSAEKKQLGRKPTLTLDAVVLAAIAVADAEGLPAVSMNRVAKSLGVGTMTLYTYVATKAELIDLMVDQVLVMRNLPEVQAQQAHDWRAHVMLYAERTRQMFYDHPWLRHISLVRPPLGPGTLAGWEYLLAALATVGLAAHHMNAAVGAITSFVTASAAQEAESRYVEQASGLSHDAWWQERSLFWEKYFSEEQYPMMVQVWHAQGFTDHAQESSVQAYEFGLARLLDGIASASNPV